MKVDNIELMEEFHEELKETYPDIHFDQLKDVLFGPWRYLREQMETGFFPDVRFEYFGVFKVYPGRAKHLLNNLEERLDKGLITPEFYAKYHKLLTDFIKSREDVEKS